MTTCSSNDISCLCSDAHFFTAVAACNAGNCTVVETLSNHTALVVTDHKHIEHGLTFLHREHERNLCGVWRSSTQSGQRVDWNHRIFWCHGFADGHHAAA